MKEDMAPAGKPIAGVEKTAKPYEKPRLTVFGSVAELTQGGPGSISEGVQSHS